MKSKEKIKYRPFRNALAVSIILGLFFLLIIPGGEFTIFNGGALLIILGLIAITIISIRGLIQIFTDPRPKNKIKLYFSIIGNSIGILPVIYIVIKTIIWQV